MENMGCCIRVVFQVDETLLVSVFQQLEPDVYYYVSSSFSWVGFICCRLDNITFNQCLGLLQHLYDLVDVAVGMLVFFLKFVVPSFQVIGGAGSYSGSIESDILQQKNVIIKLCCSGYVVSFTKVFCSSKSNIPWWNKR